MKQYLLSIYQPDGGPPPPEVLDPVMRALAELNAALDDLSGEVVSHVVNVELASAAGDLALHRTRPPVELFLSRYSAQR